MLNPPISEQNKEINNNNAMIIVPPIDLGKVDKSVVTYQFYLQIVNGLLILFNVMFTEYLCMIRLTCQPNGIEINEFLARSIPAFFFLTFFLQIFSFYGSYYVKKNWVKKMKYLNFVYFLLVLIFSIIAFILTSQLDSGQKKSVWDALTPLSKKYYDSDINTFVDKNKENLVIVGIYYLIIAFLFLINFIILWNFDYVMPFNWRPQSKLHLSLEKEGVLKETEKQKFIKRQIEKQIQFKESLFNSGNNLQRNSKTSFNYIPASRVNIPNYEPIREEIE